MQKTSSFVFRLRILCRLGQSESKWENGFGNAAIALTIQPVSRTPATSFIVQPEIRFMLREAKEVACLVEELQCWAYLI